MRVLDSRPMAAVHSSFSPVLAREISRLYCMEATYPYAIKNQRKAKAFGFGCLKLVLQGIREPA